MHYDFCFILYLFEFLWENTEPYLKLCFYIFSVNNIVMKNFLIISLSLVLVFTIINTTIIPVSEDNDNSINAILSVYPKSKTETRIMTYNILSDSAGFEGSSAFTRANGVCSILNNSEPDVIGLQEVSRNWLFCLSQNTDYKIINNTRNTILGTMTVLAYNPQTLLLLHSGECVFTEGTHTRLRRIIWGVFERKIDGKKICVINTHLSLSKTDGEYAVNQAFELVSFINDLYYRYDAPVFLTGDFNAGERRENCVYLPSVYEIILTSATDTKKSAFNISFGIGKNTSASTVDHIFIRGNIDIKNYVLLSQTQFSKLSDHYPVFVDCIL